MNNYKTIESAFSEVTKYNKEQLTSLLKEIKAISDLDAPRYGKQSDTMKKLFELERFEYRNFSEQLSNVRRAIEIEILDRIRKDNW